MLLVEVVTAIIIVLAVTMIVRWKKRMEMIYYDAKPAHLFLPAEQVIESNGDSR